MIKILIFLVCLITPHLGFSQSAQSDIAPPQVYQKAVEINLTLIGIAKEMGIEIVVSKPIEVADVSPREVYFQAATLYSKTSRLMFEFTSEEGKAIEVNKTNALPADVLVLLVGVERHLMSVAKVLKISHSIVQPKTENSASPKDVFQLIVQLNRLTNQLLDFRFSPAESHQKVTESIALASAILQTYPKASAVFYPDERISGKTPTDVYQRLAGMYQDLSLLFAKFDKTCLVLGESEKHRTDVQPSDVYDLAVLFASQLGYWHSILPAQPKVKQSYYPGKVLPSDVYQRLSILQKQVDELIRINNVKLRK